jgi:hypothetical protein
MKKTNKKLTALWRIIYEVAFIIFLFYSNLLMGEYERSGMGHSKGLLWAINDILTMTNFIIAVILALIGHLVFEYLLNK